MNAQDLMIGDWVYVVYNSIKHTAKVEKLDYDIAVICNGVPDDWQDGDDFDDIEPIPLTPEILEKNGFTRYGQVYANLQQWVGKLGDKRKSFVQDIRTGEWGMNDVWINYVHELQHVLKLCGIEKEIEL